MSQDGPAFYFKPLKALLETYRPVIDAHRWKEPRPKGVVIDAAILFIDMAGFSSLVLKYAKAPHAAAFLVYHYLSLIENWCIPGDEIQRTYVDKVIGDEVMLVIPGQRIPAIESALRLSRAPTMGPAMYASRIGLHWGPVWLGDAGLPAERNRHEALEVITVVGHTVNVAARLLGNARRGEIAVLAESLGEQPPTLQGVPIPSSFVPEHDDFNGMKGVRESTEVVHGVRLQQTATVPGHEHFPAPEKVVEDYLAAAGDPPGVA